MTEPPRLFLVTPPIADAARFAPLLEAAVGAAGVACVRLRTAMDDPSTVEAIVRVLAPIAQRHGAAVLVDLELGLAKRLDVDGVHVDGGGPPLTAALAALQPGRIVGAGALAARDAAMEAGEAGVDYVMFGGPTLDVDHDRIVEEAGWWAEIFNVPCVAYARRPDLAGALARTGAEFIALCDGLWDDDADAVAATIRAAAFAVAPAGEMAR